MERVKKWLEDNCDRMGKENKKTKYYKGGKLIGDTDEYDFYLYLNRIEELIMDNKIELSVYRELREMEEVKSFLNTHWEW